MHLIRRLAVLLACCLAPTLAGAGPTSLITLAVPPGGPEESFSPGVRLASDLGLVEEEFLVSGVATVYTYGNPPVREEPIPIGIFTDIPYTTRIIVRRPADSADFNGTVVIEWWNSTAGFDTAPVWDPSAEFFARAGWIYIGVTNSTTSLGFLTGGCSLFGFLPPTCPTRYASLSFANAQAYDMGSQIAGDVTMPLVTMVSYSIIHRVGLEKYVDSAKAAGYAGAIVPDLLFEEADEMSNVCRRQDFSLIQLVTPTTPRERQVRIAELSSGFLYYVSVTGITGERTALPSDLIDNVGWLRKQTNLPICIGFGISGPETAAQLAPVADGLIVGSAVVRRVAEANDKTEAVRAVTQFVEALRESIDAVG